MRKLAFAALVIAACFSCDAPFGMARPHEGEPCDDATECEPSMNVCEPNVCSTGYCDGTLVIGDGVLVRASGALRECQSGHEVPTNQTTDCADCKSPYAPCTDHSQCLSGNCSVSYYACGGTNCCAEHSDGHDEGD